MYCQKCGSHLQENDKFCQNCGEKVLNNNSINLNNQDNNQFNNNYGQPIPNNNGNSYQPNYNNYNMPKKKSNAGKIIVFIIIGLILLVVIFIAIAFFASKKLICESNEGSITIYYYGDNIIASKYTNFVYDQSGQNKYAKKVGMDAYIKEFSEWFSKNSTGSCKLNGVEVVPKRSTNTNSTSTNTNNNSNTSTNTTNVSRRTVGDTRRGYVSVPSTWTKFVDPDAPGVIQYSYFGKFIVTMESYEKKGDAKEYASNYMYSKQNSTDVKDVTGATVQIGKSKKYTAYQVYMFYPQENIYLITYFFEAEDGLIHYLALEGPGSYGSYKLSDFLSIPESFSLKNY